MIIKPQPMEKEYKQLFVGGDLSGIQKFLYNITSKYASVSLRGRSAYLRNYLLDVYNKLEKVIMSQGGGCKKLYCSGGKFYFTTKNTPAIIEAIDKKTANIESKLWSEHKGQLGLNISYVAFRECDGKYYVEGHENEEETSSGVLFKYCNANFARLKNQKFRSLILNNYKDFFEPINVGKDSKVCALTGIESSSCVTLKEENADEEIFVLPSVYQQIKLGKDLRNAEHFKTFEQYATTDGGTLGDTYLGILRMDIDGMGKRFITGFPTLEAYHTFSRKVTNFFEGDEENAIPSVIHLLLKKPVDNNPRSNKTYQKYLNVIYAGGDDLFIIGRWDKLIDFAKEIHDAVANPTEEFLTKEYNFDRNYIDKDDKENPNKRISISGGISIVDPKFPIAKAAELAGEAEEAAKSYRKEKDAFNMFGKTITWDTEFDKVKKYKESFVSIIDRYNASRAILHKMMLFSEISDKNERHPDAKDFGYIWQSAYYLKRYKSRYNFEEVKRLCDNLSNQMLDNRELQLIAVAARWAELTLRTTNNN